MKCRVVSVFGDHVTHFVSHGDETPLLVEVTNRPGASCRVVSDAWVIACYSFLNVMASKAYPVRRVVNVTVPDPDLADVLEEAKEESESEQVKEDAKEESEEVKEEVKEKKSMRREDRICSQTKKDGKEDVEEMRKRRRRMFLG